MTHRARGGLWLAILAGITLSCQIDETKGKDKQWEKIGRASCRERV